MREAALKIRFDKSKGLYYYSLPPALSGTGKRKRLHFKDERTAKERLNEFKRAKDEGYQIIQRNSTERVRDLLQWDEELKSVYGVAGGLGEIFNKYKKREETHHEAMKFGSLCDAYEAKLSPQWSRRSISSWKWLRGRVKSLDEESVHKLDIFFWEKWIENISVERVYKPRTIRDILNRLSCLWRFGVERSYVDKNPISGVIRPKLPTGSPSILSIEEARNIMACAWKNDKEVVPYFAIAIFAGLRPDYASKASEITNLLWKDIDFSRKRIHVSPENKTRSRRLVDMRPNLIEWLSPWQGKVGNVCPKNLRRRVEKVLNGSYGASKDIPRKQWKPLIDPNKNRHDIFRHTFGSFYAVGRSDKAVMKAMGHTNIKTFENHYRNPDALDIAEDFWSIFPPKD